MSEKQSETIAWVKLPPKYWFALALVSGGLIFLPKVVTERLGVSSLVSDYRTWIGLSCLVSVGFLLAHYLWNLKDLFWSTLEEKRMIKAGCRALRGLTSAEKRILSEYLIFKTKSRKLNYQSGVVNNLERENIIYRASTIGHITEGFAYNLQPWAWEELGSHKELLEPEYSGLVSELREERL